MQTVPKEDQYQLDTLARAIFEKKGVNILGLDVRALSTMTSYFILAEGGVGRHVKAIASGIKEILKEIGLFPFHTDGEKDGEWVVIDYGHIVVHLFIPEMRERYALEEVWRQSKIIDLNILGKS